MADEGSMYFKMFMGDILYIIEEEYDFVKENVTLLRILRTAEGNIL